MSTPAITRRRVDFPVPLRPTRPTRSPACTVTDRSVNSGRPGRAAETRSRSTSRAAIAVSNRNRAALVIDRESRVRHERGDWPVEFTILGSLAVADSGAVVTVSGGKQRRLLTILLVHANQVVSADHLTEHLWDGHPPANAPGALWSYVSNLRRLLGDRLVTQRPGYVLKVATDELDAARFEAMVAEGRRLVALGDMAAAWDRLDSAQSLWSGPALAEYADQPFAITAAARLEELRTGAIEE